MSQLSPARIHDSCKAMTELIADYLAGRLSAGIKREFENHLKVCPDCVSFLNTYRKTVEWGAAVRAEDIPAAVRANVLEFLRRKIRKIAVLVLSLLSVT